MKRSLVVMVLVVLLAGIWAVAKFMDKRNGQLDKSQSQTAITQERNEAATGSIWDLLKTGATQKCAFLSEGENIAVSQGDLYVSGDRMRVNFVTDLKEQTGVENHMIKDGDYVYTWAETAKSGAKFKIDPKAETSWSDSAPAEGLSNLSKNLKYSCESWDENDDEFKLPENVNFVDISVK